ncbi:MAG TPA: glyoxylate carboligase, partial [Cyanobacteria bacterium UBA8530]|nr:glyoxylate carboligase [Cyanobacteria bacterium UBA8530]
MNVSEAIVKVLESIGVEHLFSGSGQGSGELLFAFSESEKIETIMVKNEQAASFMACGYAMFSDKLGVCSAQGGPGAFNFFSGLGIAYSDSLPILSIASYTPTFWRGKGDLGEVTGSHRTPNGPVMYGATTKKTFLLENPAHVYDLMEEAINTAFEGRPGPVHIDLPYDVAREEAPPYREIVLKVKPVLPQEKKINQFAEVLAQGIENKKKVVAIIGYGCIRSHAEADLLAFVERFQIPFITTMDAKGVIADNHPLSLGMSGTCGDLGARRALKEADVVLAVGNSFAKWQSWRFKEDIFDDKVLMQINLDRHEISKVFKADFAMVSDAKPAMRRLTDALGSRITVREKARPQIDRHCFQPLSYQGGKVHPGQLSQELGRLLPEKAIVLGDAGAHMIWMAAYMQLNGGQSFKNPGSFGPMASHTNAAIGVQLAAPGRRVIVGCGDGCYQMAG